MPPWPGGTAGRCRRCRPSTRSRRGCRRCRPRRPCGRRRRSGSPPAGADDRPTGCGGRNAGCPAVRPGSRGTAWSGSSSWSLTIMGGSLISCGRPSTTSTSLAKAFMLSLARALATFLRNLLSCARLELGAQHGLELVDVQPRVPDVELPHPGPVVHGLPVRRPDREVGGLALGLVEAAVSSGDREAGRQPLDVPLERAGQGLVEVVEAEDEPAVRGGEDPEVRQVRVAAQLDRQSGAGSTPRGRRPSGRRRRGRT